MNFVKQYIITKLAYFGHPLTLTVEMLSIEIELIFLREWDNLIWLISDILWQNISWR